MRLVALLLLVTTAAAPTAAQSGGGTSARRLTTLDALRQFPGFYHLQNVVLRGELVESGARIVLRANEQEMRVVVDEGVRTALGMVEVRGLLLDVGRLEPGDPRVGTLAEGREAERWPRPGAELIIRVAGLSEAQPALAPSVRALALEPWRFDGKKVTLLGNFRGRNLFGDLPGAPGKGKYDFVVRGADGAIWVTGLRPRGRGFELDVDRRLDSDRWVEVTGTVAHERGLVRLEATEIAIAKAPQLTEVAEPDPPAIPLQPVEVVFSSPTEGETDVSPSGAIRIQFSRGLNGATVAQGIRVTYLGGRGAAQPGVSVRVSYDASTRAVELRFTEPLEPLRTVRVEMLDTLKGFDGAPVTPWTLTFSVGG